MKRRQLGTTDLHLSEIGFGAWAAGGPWRFGWGKQDDTESIAAIHRAFSLGVNWIDTAAVYGLGHSEEITGRAIAGIRDEVIIATKCSQVWDKEGSVFQNLTRDSVMWECEQSLRRLGIDRIDLYQIHWPTDDSHIEEGWEAISRLIEQGKVRYGGVSNFIVSHLDRAQAIHPIASLQPPYSMLRRARECEGEFEWCAGHGVGIVAYSPMQAGLLTGRFNPEGLAEDDWRQRNPEFQKPNLSINLDFVERLRPIAKRYDRTVAQLALAWVLRKPEVTSAIVGARRPSQIEETVGGSGWSIEMEDLNEIENLLEDRRKRLQSSGGKIFD